MGLIIITIHKIVIGETDLPPLRALGDRCQIRLVQRAAGPLLRGD